MTFSECYTNIITDNETIERSSRFLFVFRIYTIMIVQTKYWILKSPEIISLLIFFSLISVTICNELCLFQFVFDFWGLLYFWLVLFTYTKHLLYFKLMFIFNAVNSPIKSFSCLIAILACHIFVIQLKYFLISIEVASLFHCLFRSIFLNVQTYEDFKVIFLLFLA